MNIRSTKQKTPPSAVRGARDAGPRQPSATKLRGAGRSNDAFTDEPAPRSATTVPEGPGRTATVAPGFDPWDARSPGSTDVWALEALIVPDSNGHEAKVTLAFDSELSHQGVLRYLRDKPRA